LNLIPRHEGSSPSPSQENTRLEYTAKLEKTKNPVLSVSIRPEIKSVTQKVYWTFRNISARFSRLRFWSCTV